MRGREGGDTASAATSTKRRAASAMRLPSLAMTLALPCTLGLAAPDEGALGRDALPGVYGQAICVDPGLNLVMVRLAVGAGARGDAGGAHLAQERDALWRGIVAHCGAW